jgi:HD superfamily phosphohydrolase
MEELNRQFGGALDTAIRIFSDQYPKRFLHQMVSSQLDMDRLDYLSRDSFFTGVAEGVINTDRIINILTVVNDELVVEAKGIYSIEKFILSRRLMYWQVYLHKAVLAADRMLISILRRAKFLADRGEELFAPPALRAFLRPGTAPCGPSCLPEFSKLDDNDFMSSVKAWMDHPDPILSVLCTNLTDRHLFRAEIQNDPFGKSYVDSIRARACKRFGLTEEETGYFVVQDTITNNAYTPKQDRIRVVMKDNRLLDVAEYSEQLNISVLSTTVTKHMLCYPKILEG